MKLVIGKKYKWKHEDVIMVYLGRNGYWNVFDKFVTGKIWCEVLDSDLYLLEEVK